MWNILGKDVLYIEITDTFKNRIVELADKESEEGKKFLDIIEKTDVKFLINGQSEESSFLLKVPDELTPEDIDSFANVVLKALTDFGGPAVSVGGNEQRYKVIISNDKEPELIGLNKTPGLSSYEVFKPILNGWGAPGKENMFISKGTNGY